MKLTHKLSALYAAALLSAPFAVLADSTTDHQIERDAIKNMPSNISDKVSVSVQDGFATVTGTVYNDSQRSVAISAIKQVPQVKGVVDQIKVDNGRGADLTAQAGEPADHHSDKWIAFKVKSELVLHKNVSATHTDVNVVDGVVILSGTARNEAQRELTAQYAKTVEGVRDVKNEIQIRDDDAPVATTTPPRSTFAGDSGNTTGDKIDDSTITTKVKYQLATHKSTSALKTTVHTQDGVVFISGNADNPAEKDLVTQLATGVSGVANVHNDMIVQNP